MQAKKWSDLSPAQQGLVISLAVIQIALFSAAMWDLRHRPDEAIHGDKRWWTAALFVNFIGPISYFLIGRR